MAPRHRFERGGARRNVAAASGSYDKNLVNSPVAGVCFACHDTSSDMAHFDLNGGSIYKARTAALNQRRDLPDLPRPRQDRGHPEVHSH